LNDDGRSAGANEWCLDLYHILNVMKSLYIECVETIKGADKWGVYFYEKRGKYQKVKVIDEKEIKSRLYDGIMYDTQNTRSKRI